MISRHGTAWLGLGLLGLLGCACNEASSAPPRGVTPTRGVSGSAARAGADPPAGGRRTRPRAADPGVVLEARDGPVSVRVEVARDSRTRSRGLMFRREMDEGAGMVFLFDRPEVQSFWMRNTYLPLDMIFIGSDLRVVGVVENAEPLTDTSRTVDQPSQYVLEVNAGFARRHGIGPGTPVRFEGFEW